MPAPALGLFQCPQLLPALTENLETSLDTIKSSLFTAPHSASGKICRGPGMTMANCFLLPELTAGSCCCQQQYPHPLNLGALPWGVTRAGVNQPCWSQGLRSTARTWLEDLPHPQNPDPCRDRAPLGPSELPPGQSFHRTDLWAVLLAQGLRWSDFGGTMG